MGNQSNNGRLGAAVAARKRTLYRLRTLVEVAAHFGKLSTHQPITSYQIAAYEDARDALLAQVSSARRYLERAAEEKL